MKIQGRYPDAVSSTTHFGPSMTSCNHPPFYEKVKNNSVYERALIIGKESQQLVYLVAFLV